jgi:PAS domain S-box-containing protein
MTPKSPAFSPPTSPATADAAATLAAIDDALKRDRTLPEATRELLLQARQALQDACAEADSERHRYRALFDALPDPVSIIAYDGTVLDLNRAGLESYRRPREELVGQPIETINPDLPKDHMAPVLETLNRGGSYMVEVTNMRSDGTRFPVEVHTGPLEYDGSAGNCAIAS